MISLMKIISYNVNGIRAALRKGLDEWLQKAAPDVLCIQESKAQPEQIDQAYFAELGYQSHWHSAQKKGYSGVGILSRQAPDYVEAGTGLDYIDQEGRVIRADFGELTVLSVYVPSGTTGGPRQEVKMRFLEDFQRYVLHLRASRPQLVLCGDFNICHTEIDIHNPKQNQKTSGFLPEERAWVSQFLEQGFVDAFRHLHPGEPDHYSWWSYRANARARNKGWRIDYNFLSQPLAARLQHARILNQAYHSDHCPVLVGVE
jgi:exodeoxyribonuclease-3